MNLLQRKEEKLSPITSMIYVTKVTQKKFYESSKVTNKVPPSNPMMGRPLYIALRREDTLVLLKL